MSIVREFRTFLMRGNVIDLAVGVIAGTAFTAVVNSLVRDIITPLVATVFGSPDFSGIVLVGKPASGGGTVWFTMDGVREGVTGGILVGNFLNAVVSFLLVMAGVFFLIVKPVNAASARLTRAQAAEPPTVRDCPECLSEIPVAATRCSHCTTEVAPAV